MENRRDQNRVKKAELGVHLLGKHSTQEVEAGVVQEFKTSLTYIVSRRPEWTVRPYLKSKKDGKGKNGPK